MPAKPFGLQSPEEIAKDYGGNKQKIAQAMQLGIVDSTAGVLAGMFIDKMRSAQMQEQAQQPTVAQQVMGGAPATPPAPPAGGLGATPQGAPPMAPPAPPQGGMPPAPPQGGAPMGMAEGGMVPPYASGGGLSDLPVPDTMFDEPSNGGFGDGYADGGLVAFADGGTSSPMGPWFESEVKRLYPNAIISGRARTPEHNREVGGVSNSFHIGNNALDVQPPPGMSFTEFGSALRQHFGPSVDTIFNTKGHYDHVHLEPGPELGKQLRSGTVAIPERDIGTAAGRFNAPMDVYRELQKSFGPSPEEQEVDVARMTRARELASPEYQDKIRKQDMWEALAQIGFNMASSKSPYLLQAVGEAAAAALPGARVARKEREALKDRALDAMGAINGARRKDNLALFGAAVDMAKAGQQQEQFEANKGLEGRRLDLTERQMEDERNYKNALLGIEQYKAQHPAMSDLESAVSYFMAENPGMSRTKALEEVYKLRQQYAPSAGTGTFPGAPNPQSQAAAAGQFRVLGTE